MNAAEKKLAEILGSGRKPTVDDLECALAAVLKERNALRAMNRDMGEWLSKLVLAYSRDDGAAVADILGAFMQQNVRMMPPSAGKVH